MSYPYITDTLLKGHVQNDGSANFPLNYQDQFGVSPSNAAEQHLKIWAEEQREFNFNWFGIESAAASLRTHWATVWVSDYYYMFMPISETFWAAVDLQCGFPSESGSAGGLGKQVALTDITIGVDTTIHCAGHGLQNIADDVYVYLTEIVSTGAGGGPHIDDTLNGALHKVTAFTDSGHFDIATDTSACTDAYDSAGTVVHATFIIPGRDTSGHIVKDDGTTKTLTTHYLIETGKGLGDEDVIQCTTAWQPDDGHAITCAFIGRRRYLVRYTINRFDIKPTNRYYGANRLFVLPVGMREMKKRYY